MFLFMYSHFHINSLSHVCKILVIVSGKIKINYNKKRILIHTEEKPYDKSVHTRDEPYIYDFIIVRLINILLHKNNTLSNLLVKINHFGHR